MKGQALAPLSTRCPMPTLAPRHVHLFFFFNDTPTPEIYTLSLHDALPIYLGSGKLRWKYSAGSPIGESSPAVAREMVFVGDSAGVLHAVRTRDGSRAWTFKTAQEIKSSPVVVDAIVLIGSYDGHLYALDAATGALRWKAATEGPVHATPAVQDGVAFVAGCDE